MTPIARKLVLGLLTLGLATMAGCAVPAGKAECGFAGDLVRVDAYTFAGPRNLLRDYPATDAAGDLNALVEISAGTNQKWEVDPKTGRLGWEFKDDKPRVVSYLGYPVNYGMIPQTNFAKELGGDGDPLDVLVLGPAVPRGAIVKARLIGVIKLTDSGERDDKLMAVLADGPLGGVSSIEELDRKFNGVTKIIELWTTNYKGPGKVTCQGFAEVKEARALLAAAMAAFQKQAAGGK